MPVKQDISLKPYNSFGMDVNARYFAAFHTADSLLEILSAHKQPPALVLGGGTNLLITRDIDGLVIKNEISGIEKMAEDEESVFIKVGAGENWHGFVEYCIAHGYAGVENLALIPGAAGASPMQNIGAYGTEVKVVLHEVQAMHIHEGVVTTFTNQACEFGYRDSIFKNKYKGQFVILDVTFRLRKKPQFNTSYGAIRQELERMGVQELSIRAVADAVIHIRQSKLPDPAVTGNAGSFFKNPVISQEQFISLQKQFPGIPAHTSNNAIKLAAGWLIEQCGWKGYRKGDAGCFDKQALVLVNYGKASGEEIITLANDITDSVEKKFGIKLEKEVNII